VKTHLHNISHTYKTVCYKNRLKSPLKEIYLNREDAYSLLPKDGNRQKQKNSRQDSKIHRVIPEIIRVYFLDMSSNAYIDKQDLTQLALKMKKTLFPKGRIKPSFTEVHLHTCAIKTEVFKYQLST
jgi:hypothetical protein